MTPDGPPEGSRFAIVSLPRSGSTTMARLLNCHPDIRCLVEPFHPTRYEGQFRRLAVQRGLGQALARIWSRWNGIKHVWESTGWPFMEQPELNHRLLSTPGLRIVFLVRRNWLRRLVSNLICRQTQYWIGRREEFCSRLDQVRLRPLDPRLVRRQIERDREAVRRCLEALAGQGASVLTLYHEDVFREGATTEERLSLVNVVLGFLRFSTICEDAFRRAWEAHFDPDANRWASSEVYARIPGIARVEEEAGSDETGWLFKGEDRRPAAAPQ